MLTVVDEHLEGVCSELFELLGGRVSSLNVLQTANTGVDIAAFVFRPSQPWLIDSLSSERCKRDLKPHFLDVLSPIALSRLQARSSFLIIDLSREATYVDLASLNDFHRELDKRRIDRDKVIIVTPNSDYARQYSNLFSTNVGGRVQIAYHNYFFYKTTVEASAYLGPRFQQLQQRFYERLFYWPPIKDYLCLNFAPRAHRIHLILELVQRSLDAQGIISLSDLKLRPKGISQDEPLRQVKQSLSDSPTLDQRYSDLVTRSPIVADVQTTEFEALEFDIPFDLASKTFYTIVTETIFLAPLYKFVTEKTVKALATFQPFILVANAHSLDFIRSLGFQSFDPLINEDYDTIDDNRCRMEKIIGEIGRIASQDPDSKRRWALDLWPIACHNAEHLTNKLPQILDFKWTMPLLRRLEN